jgi:branched-chain amino acid transport system substrate-binding protein
MKKIIKSWKFIPCLVLLLVLSLVVGGCGSNSQKAASEAYKIGAVIDISGNSSSLGVPERDTLKMMVENLNAKGGINGHLVELEILDNKSTEQEAVTAVKGLIDKGVLAVIGCSSSGTSMAMIPTVQNAKIPMISLAAASSIVEPAGERQWVFKTPQSDIVMVNKIIGYLKSNNLQKVAFMSMNNSYGDGGKKVFDTAAKENNITVVAEEKFDATDKDMTPQLTRVKANGAQAVIVWAIPPSASILTKNFKDMGLTIPLIHSHGVGNQSFIDLAQGAADGVILPIGKLTVADQIAADDPQKKVLDSYITDYTKKYNSAPNSFGGYAVDAFNLLVSAIEKGGADRAAIRDQLEKTQGYTGISGIYNMSAQDHNGLKADSAVMVKIENGKWKLIK